MKNLIVLAFALVSLNVFAQEVPDYYSAQFRIVRNVPFCPAPRPGQMTCMAIGGKIIVEATIGCADKLVFSSFEEIVLGDRIVLHAVSLVRKNENSDRIRCVRPQVIRQEIGSSKITGKDRIQIVNIDIETR